MKILLTLSIVCVAGIATPVGQDARYRSLGGSEVRFEELQPWGWRFTLSGTQVQPEIRTLIGGRLRSFKDVYLRRSRLVGLGATTSGEAFLVWDLEQQCQVIGAMGFGIKRSPDGRFVIFEQYVTRGEKPNGSIYRVVDVDGGDCSPGAHTEEALQSIVSVGEVVLPSAVNNPRVVSTLESRSPRAWIGGGFVFVTRNSATNLIELHRYAPYSKRISSRTLDWRPLASPADLAHSPHPSAAFSFKSVRSLDGEGKNGHVRLQLAEDYAHAAKWVDMELPVAK